MIQGAAAKEWAAAILGVDAIEEPTHPFDDALARHPKPPPAVWAGIDETGKGDYFGPLVVVAAAVSRDRVPLLRELGVGDSKRIADGRILDLAKQLKTCCRFRKLVIGPEKYNQLYPRIGNLNRLLAWGHARALEDLLEIVPECTWALSDKFARASSVLERQLLTRAREIRVDQWPKAESDPAVAVASILARAEFLWRMRALEQRTGYNLPKGAGGPTLAAARKLVANGADRADLAKVAKLHFRTTEQLGLSQ